MTNMKSVNKDVYLDLDNPSNIKDDNIVGINELAYFHDKESIGKRSKKMGAQGILYPTKSVDMYIQARRLYILGLFESSIIVCRATAEYIANEIFENNINKNIKNKNILDFVCENMDFRKIVNNYLYKYKIISRNDKEIFNRIYDTGNKYVHPKKNIKNIENDSEELINKLKSLILSLRNMLNDYDIVNGILRKKGKNNIF